MKGEIFVVERDRWSYVACELELLASVRHNHGVALISSMKYV